MRSLQLQDNRMMELLLEFGADVSIPNVKGDTIVHIICNEGDSVTFGNILRSCREYGANRKAKSTFKVPAGDTDSLHRMYSTFKILGSRKNTPFGSVISRLIREKKREKVAVRCYLIIRRFLGLAKDHDVDIGHCQKIQTLTPPVVPLFALCQELEEAQITENESTENQLKLIISQLYEINLKRKILNETNSNGDYPVHYFASLG